MNEKFISVHINVWAAVWRLCSSLKIEPICAPVVNRVVVFPFWEGKNKTTKTWDSSLAHSFISDSTCIKTKPALTFFGFFLTHTCCRTNKYNTTMNNDHNYNITSLYCMRKITNTLLLILRLSSHGLLSSDFTLVNCVIKSVSEITSKTEIMWKQPQPQQQRHNAYITIMMSAEACLS